MPIVNSIPCNIPFLDLVTPHVELEQRTHRCISPSLAISWLHWRSNGRGLLRRRLRLSVAQTTLLRSAMVRTLCVSPSWLAGVQPGDVVLTVPHTFIATTEAISQAGAMPEFIDIDERTYNMSVEKLQAVSERAMLAG